MYWNRVSSMYDLFETAYNRKVYRGTGTYVGSLIQPTDTVLECACGTGAISVDIAPNCRRLMATDFSEGMMKQAAKKLKHFDNVRIGKAPQTFHGGTPQKVKTPLGSRRTVDHDGKVLRPLKLGPLELGHLLDILRRGIGLRCVLSAQRRPHEEHAGDHDGSVHLGHSL